MLVRTRGGSLIYMPYRYAPSQRVGFWALFGLKFAHFGLGSDMVFEVTTGAYMYGRIYRFNSRRIITK